jgi:hypothetical protein
MLSQAHVWTKSEGSVPSLDSKNLRSLETYARYASYLTERPAGLDNHSVIYDEASEWTSMAVIWELIQKHEVRDDQHFCSDGDPATEALCGVRQVNEERDVSLEDLKHRLESTDSTSRFLLAKVSNEP